MNAAKPLHTPLDGPAPATTPVASASTVAAVPPTLEAFMAQALAMELEAVERYTDFADAMETHNNLEVGSMSVSYTHLTLPTSDLV